MQDTPGAAGDAPRELTGTVAARAPLARWLHIPVVAAPAILYLVTASRTPGWADAALVVSQAAGLELSSWVDTHSLFNLLGFLWLKLFGPGDVHFHLVLLCGLFSVAAAFFVYRALLELGSHSVGALASALVLSVSHSVWWHATMVEAYSLNAALIAAMVFLVARHGRTARPLPLYAAALLWGLGCTNHLLMWLFLPSFVALLVYRILRPIRRNGLHLAVAILCFFAGLSFYLVLFAGRLRTEILAFSAPGEPWPRAAREGLRAAFDASTGGEFRGLMFPRGLAPQVRRFWRLNYLFWFALNFPSPALPAGLFGLWLLLRKRQSRLAFLFVAAGLVAQATWSANYLVWDMYAFSMPVYVLFSIPVGLAAGWMLQRGRWAVGLLSLLLAVSLVAPGILYARLPSWYRAGGALARFLDSYPQMAWTAHTWDPVPYVVNPDKRAYDKVERYAQALFAALPAGSHLLNSDCRSDYPLRYYYRDICGMRRDIVHHPLYSPWLTPGDALPVARELEQALAAGEPVFSASALYPEKLVLDQLALLLDPARSIEELQGMGEAEYVRRFPVVALEKVVLFEEEQIWVYRLQRRSSDAARQP